MRWLAEMGGRGSYLAVVVDQDQDPYREKFDTLVFHNSEPVSYSESVVEHCMAHLDAEGDPVSITLERASERILPLLLQCTRGKKPHS